MIGLLVGLSGACGTDAIMLPKNFFNQKVKTISIDYQSDEGALSNLSGLQGGPAPLVSGDKSLQALYMESQVNIVRVPQGYLCPYSLSWIFPDASADAFDPASYKFQQFESGFAGYKPEYPGLDLVVEKASAVGARVVFQAYSDLGTASCTVDAAGKMQGQPLVDPAKWAHVVANVVRHYSKNILDPNRPGDTRWIPGAKSFNLNHIEFIDEPMGRGGYTDVSVLAAHFAIFADVLKDEVVFPKFATGDSFITLIAPSMLIAGANEVATHPMWDFVSELQASGKLDSLDVLSYKTRVSSPQENHAIAIAIREKMTALGLEKKLWNVGYRASSDANPSPSGSKGTVGYWSSYEGAFATASKILWQGLVDEAVYDRGDRRWLTMEQDDINQVENSPLWDKAGAKRPAGISWLPWLIMASSGLAEENDKVRLSVSAPSELDAPGLAVSAVKCVGNSDVDEGSDSCTDKIYILIANSNTQLKRAKVSYQITISGIDDDAVEPRTVKVQRSRIDQNTKEFAFGPDSFVQLSRGQSQEQKQNCIIDNDCETSNKCCNGECQATTANCKPLLLLPFGSLSLTIDSTVPSTDFILIDLSQQ
ncbi:MAG TPA: hypothetical protein EYN66_12560 [Myxococcales bacterium]|nr:hypothetical protein [Myxococcales bacterium]